MTAPLVPPEVDLRGLPWMRLDTARLIDSDLFALSSGDEFKAAVALWCKSWTQQPGASLPNDDRILAHLSGAGTRWKRVKAMALRGWVLCDDGRLYHPVVAAQAIAAWEERLEFRREQDSSNERKRKERAERAAMFDRLKAAGHDLAWNTSTSVLRDMCRDLSREESRQRVTPVTVTVTAMTGEGEGRESITPVGIQRSESHLSAREFENVATVRPITEAGRACLLMREAGCVSTNPSHPGLLDALALGVTPEVLANTVREGLARLPPIAKPFAWAITTARGRHAAGASQINGANRGTDQPRESLVDRNARRAAEILGRTGTQ